VLCGHATQVLLLEQLESSLAARCVGQGHAVPTWSGVMRPSSPRFPYLASYKRSASLALRVEVKSSALSAAEKPFCLRINACMRWGMGI
jgi:hypothetical protein